VISLVIDMETRSEGNLRGREPWQARSKRMSTQRDATTAALLAHAGVGGETLAAYGPRLLVTLTRLASRDLDTDNLSSSLKGPRDAIAAWLGVNDGPKGPVRWAYAQERRTDKNKKLGGVRIEITRAP